MGTFAEHLTADGPNSHKPKRLELFGRLVGSWRVHDRQLDVATGLWIGSERQWIFSWILDGRGVQDVIVALEGDNDGVTLGTTVRVYDRALGLWRVNWFGPAAGNYCTLVASAHRNGIRQDGTDTDGQPIRWNFSNVTTDSFEWDGWISLDDGATWLLEQHMEARRES